ncbi:MAG: hypothetical protein ATN31_03480 [Candidatus Epulonipiscioides saccharophilum]|nr:MAG: hypothetical protein ATN31_03480 [Epulopiscium sp. AS2M-Bin001]
MLKNNPKMDPFAYQYPVDWVEVLFDDLAEIPQINAEWLKKLKTMKHYNKFILGQDQERNQFYLGILALTFKSKRNDPPIDNIIAFVLKEPKTSRSTISGNGYWIVAL